MYHYLSLSGESEREKLEEVANVFKLKKTKSMPRACLEDALSARQRKTPKPLSCPTCEGKVTSGRMPEIGVDSWRSRSCGDKAHPHLVLLLVKLLRRQPRNARGSLATPLEC